MNKIACIVVTYNRLHLLKRCIESLRLQTNKNFDIIVINNNSNDGTEEWLQNQHDIKTITQENLGGAGGFYTGMQTAFRTGYEWLWMMDDDGVTDPQQLDYLYQECTTRNIFFANALVCNVDAPDYLAFGLGQINRRSEAQKVDVIDTINPFNGTFIHRNVIEKIGFVKKEMFIWGDEKEYTLRAIKHGFKPMTITKAIHLHPSVKSIVKNVIPFVSTYKVILKPANRSKIYYRNKGYICSTYKRGTVKKIFFFYCLYFALRFQFVELLKFNKYFKRGCKNIFETIDVQA